MTGVDDMNLELVSYEPEVRLYAPPILFVHGAWCAAWCWNEHFLSYFVERGWAVHAMSLRGHGASEGREGLRRASVANYVSDVERVVARLGSDPVLVGHSMGGFVVQRYLERHRSPAAVLMASAPHNGLSWRFVLRLMRRNLGSFLRAGVSRSTKPLASIPDLADYFFSADMPKEQLLAYSARLQEESMRAFVDMLGAGLPRPGHVNTRMLVLAAGDDHFLTPAEMYGLAHAYCADLEVVPGVGHVMMLAPAWESAAQRVADWLERVVGGG